MLGDSALKQFHDFTVIREAAQLFFRVDQFAVNRYFEDTTTAWNQSESTDFCTEMTQDLIRQTDGAW